MGIVLGWQFLESINIQWVLIGLTILFIFCLFSHFRISKIFPCFVFPLILLLGIANIYFTLAVFPPDHLTVLDHKGIKSFEGWIDEAHYKENGKHRYVLNCEVVYFDSTRQNVSAKIILNQGKFTGKLKYGDVIRVQGRPQLPPLPGNPGEFNYRRYLQMNHVYYQYYLPSNDYCLILNSQKGSLWKKKIIIPIRNHIIMLLDRHVSPPTKDIVKALLLGERQDVDRGIVEDFQKTGVVHVLAISGLHVGFILLVFIFVFSLLRLPYHLKIGFSLFFLFLFVALVNFKAPVVRASLMAGLYFAAKLSERQNNSLNIIAVAGLIILFIEPQQLFLPGFQFSFAAVGAILYGYPKLSNIFPWRTNGNRCSNYFNKFIRQPFLVSAAAVLGTFPLTWWYYGTLQIGALFINILIIPLIGGFVLLSFLFLTIGSIGLFAAGGLARLLHYYFLLILRIIESFTKVPFIQFEFPQPSFFILFLAVVAIILIFNITKRIRWLYLIVVIFLIFIATSGWFHLHKDRLKVTFVNVGQGDGAIIQFPNGEVMIVDAGDRKFKRDAGKRYMVPLLRHYGIKRVKYLLGTHWHSDHIGGFQTIMDKVQVDTLILSEYPGKSKLYNQVVATAAKRNIPIRFKKRGQRLYIGERSRAYLLHPNEQFLKGKQFSGAEINNSSLVLKLCYGKTSFLLTGDLEQSAEKALFNYGNFLNADVLKVGHHGSKTSTSITFLDLIEPQYAVVSVGRRNRFFHPSRKTIQRLKEHNSHPLRTDHFGAIVFESDGREVRLINWRK